MGTNLEAKSRIDYLRLLLEQHNSNYYEQDDPTISDAEYDTLFTELKALESQYPEFKIAQSPTQRVGGKASGKFPTITHSTQMLSLDNVFSEQELQDFITRIGELLRLPDPLQKTHFCAEPKLDGLALALHYTNGKLTHALTRGDGITGEDVTNNARAISDIPLTLQIDKNNPTLQKIEIRGEVYMSKKTLTELNKIQQENNQKIYANSRNFAAGTIRQLDPQIVADRKLNFYAYSAITEQPFTDSHYRMLKLLSLWGVPINPETKHLRGIKQLLNYYQRIHQKRSKLAYDIDGIVYKLDNINLQQIAGTTQRAPRWAIAHKFPAEQAISIIQSIDIQIGRTGVLTPVARLEPTIVGGVTISNATLHNLDEIERKDIRPLDEVFIRRAGDVIPEVVKLVDPNRTPNSPPFTIPDNCPSCANPVTREQQQAHFRCTAGANCPAQLYQSICHFISRKAMAIDGLGKQRIQQLLEQKLITNAADLYTLSQEQLSELPKMKEKSINNTLTSIAHSKKTSFSRFIYAIGIHEVGEITAQNLAQNIENQISSSPENHSQKCLDALLSISTEQLIDIEDIGPTVAQSIYQFTHKQENQRFLQQCLDNGIQWKKSTINTENQLLKGKTIVLTGTLQSMGRELAKQKLQALGAKVTTSVSPTTDIVIIGENAGSKATKAEKLNLPIWDENEFLKNINPS
jgi:DNA ligase (NAD+)